MKVSLFVRDCRIFFVFIVASALAACNYGEDSSVPAPSGPTSTSSHGGSQPVVSGTGGDHGPQISGVAVTTATAGQSYSFQPSATDADNDVLTFSILGAPSWLTLNAATGRLNGTPTSADVGVDTGIVVQVSDSKATVSLAPFNITVAAASTAGGSGGGTTTSNVDLAWVPPTENTDGSALVNLNGYKIYYGTSSNNYTQTITIPNPGLTRYVIDSLPPGTYFFSVIATTSTGVQSGYSPEVSTTIS
jgi:Putative Ig domain